MDNSTNITVVVHFNGAVITNTEQGVIFTSDESTYFFCSSNHFVRGTKC